MKLKPHVRRLLQGFLLLLCLLFSGYTLYELLRPYPLRVTGPAPPREGPAVPLGEAPAGTALPPLDAFAEVVERPLFRQDRRPFVPPPPRTGPAARPETHEQVRLSAVVMIGDLQLALVYTERDPKLQKLRAGQSYKGWRLVEIHDKSITLERGGQVTRVGLKVAPSRVPAPAAPDGDPLAERQPDEQSPAPRPLRTGPGRWAAGAGTDAVNLEDDAQAGAGNFSGQPVDADNGGTGAVAQADAPAARAAVRVEADSPLVVG